MKTRYIVKLLLDTNATFKYCLHLTIDGENIKYISGSHEGLSFKECRVCKM